MSSVFEYNQTVTLHGYQNDSAQTLQPQEQRYIEQELPVESHMSLALLALLAFPPLGK